MNGHSIEAELRPTNRRVESFSDAVFAIVITIMVLEIQIPDRLAFARDPMALREFGSGYLTYALSFFVIANLWVSHHYLIFTLSRPTRTTIWFNNLLLFCVSTLPLVTRFLGTASDVVGCGRSLRSDRRGEHGSVHAPSISCVEANPK